MERVLLALAQDLFIHRGKNPIAFTSSVMATSGTDQFCSSKWVALSTRCKSSSSKYVFCIATGSPISISKQAEVSEREES